MHLLPSIESTKTCKVYKPLFDSEDSDESVSKEDDNNKDIDIKDVEVSCKEIKSCMNQITINTSLWDCCDGIYILDYDLGNENTFRVTTHEGKVVFRCENKMLLQNFLKHLTEYKRLCGDNKLVKEIVNQSNVKEHLTCKKWLDESSHYDFEYFYNAVQRFLKFLDAQKVIHHKRCQGNVLCSNTYEQVSVVNNNIKMDSIFDKNHNSIINIVRPKSGSHLQVNNDKVLSEYIEIFENNNKTRSNNEDLFNINEQENQIQRKDLTQSNTSAKDFSMSVENDKLKSEEISPLLQNSALSSENTKNSSENTKKSSENTKNSYEDTKNSYEDTKMSSENTENTKTSSENNKNSSENTKTSSENNKTSSENTKTSSEITESLHADEIPSIVNSITDDISSREGFPTVLPKEISVSDQGPMKIADFLYRKKRMISSDELTNEAVEPIYSEINPGHRLENDIYKGRALPEIFVEDINKDTTYFYTKSDGITSEPINGILNNNLSESDNYTTNSMMLIGSVGMFSILMLFFIKWFKNMRSERKSRGKLAISGHN